MKNAFLLFITGLLAAVANAQERSFDILLGLPYAVEFGGEGSTDWTPKGGLVLGVEYWAKNKQGNAWSAGIFYNAFKRKGKVAQGNQTVEQEETFEYVKLHGMPLIWKLGKKERWFAEAGGFANLLLHQETDVNGNVTNNTQFFQRIYLGLSAGTGLRLGDEGSSKVLIGLRNDLGLASFGSAAKSLKFNALCLYVGLGI